SVLTVKKRTGSPWSSSITNTMVSLLTKRVAANLAFLGRSQGRQLGPSRGREVERHDLDGLFSARPRSEVGVDDRSAVPAEGDVEFQHVDAEPEGESWVGEELEQRGTAGGPESPQPGAIRPYEEEALLDRVEGDSREHSDAVRHLEHDARAVGGGGEALEATNDGGRVPIAGGTIELVEMHRVGTGSAGPIVLTVTGAQLPRRMRNSRRSMIPRASDLHSFQI